MELTAMAVGGLREMDFTTDEELAQWAACYTPSDCGKL